MADREQRDRWVSAEYFQSAFHGDGGTLADKMLEEMEPVAELKASLAKCCRSIVLNLI